jgi:hypothetical protein
MSALNLVTGGTCTLQASQTVSSVTVAGGSTTPGGVITFLTAVPHGLVSGDLVAAFFSGASNSMTGGAGVRPIWPVIAVDSTHFALAGSQGIQAGTGGGGSYIHLGHAWPAVEVDLSALPLPPSPWTLKVLVTSLAGGPCRVVAADNSVGGVSVSGGDSQTVAGDLLAPLAVLHFASPVGVEGVTESFNWDQLPDAMVNAWANSPGIGLCVCVLFLRATRWANQQAAGASITLNAWLD